MGKETVFGNPIMKTVSLTGREIIKMIVSMGPGNIITIMGNYPTREII